MSTEKASIALSLGNFSIRIEGSEEFVKDQVSGFRETILEHLDTQNYDPASEAPPSNKDGISNKNKSSGPLEEYRNIYHYDGDELNLLIPHIPGGNTAEKTRNSAKLYLFGKNLLDGESVSHKEEIVGICKEYGFYDSSNFKNNIQSGKPNLVVEGSGKNYEIRLTPPGIKDTKELINSIDESS